MAIIAPFTQAGVLTVTDSEGNMLVAPDITVNLDQDSYVPIFTAFSRLRVANPQTLFDCKLTVDSAPLFFDDQTTSGSASSTYMTNQASQKMSVALNTAGTRVRQTFGRFSYQPGKSHMILLTGILGAGTSGVTRRIGYFDGSNGLFFELNGTQMRVVCRTNTSGTPTDGYVNQANWNIDKLDGTGRSGITLDTSKTQIFVIDLQWLGVGRVRYGFDINGLIRYCHEINNANSNSVVYMSTPNLPVRYEISNDGTGAAADLYHICCSVISEGGREVTGITVSADMGSTVLTTGNNANIYPLIAIRYKSDHIGMNINPKQLTVINTGNDNYRYCLLLNPTIVGTALSFSDITNSAMQIATPANTTTVTGGFQIISGYNVGSGAGGSSQTQVDIGPDARIGSNIAGVSDILVVCAQRLTGTTSTFYGSLSWTEEN